LPDVRDSKELSPSARERCFDLIVDAAIDWSVSSVSHEEIAKINIHRASLEAMRRAVDGLRSRPDLLLVDGKFTIPSDLPQRALIKGDARFLPIAAASILAKVSRDRWMREAAREYPLYRFDQHKGYGTEYHREAIRRFGLTPIHRKTFRMVIS
jgi:ribonuclease HII